VQSFDDAAELNIDAQGASSSSTLNVNAGLGGSSKLYLGKSNGAGFTFESTSSTTPGGKFSIKSSTSDAITVGSSGNVTLHGAVTVKGSVTSQGKMSVGSLTVNGRITRPCPSAPGLVSTRWAENNHCYSYVHSVPKTFSDAQQYCASTGGYLATLHNAEEKSFVRTQFQPVAKKDYYIGYISVGGSKQFQWVTGEVAVFNNTHVFEDWENPWTLNPSNGQCATIYTTLEDAGASYRGRVSTTVSGKTCRRWNVDTPHGYIFSPTQYPDAGLESNYCRNPDKRASGAFCVTTDAGTTTESCDVNTHLWRNVDCQQEKPFLCERDY
jgi:hypothetical protein